VGQAAGADGDPAKSASGSRVTGPLLEATLDRPIVIPGGASTAPERHRPAVSYLASLDGIRGVFAVIVVAVHASGFARDQPKPGWIGIALVRLGQTGVGAFFILSGFLLASDLCIRKSSTQSFLWRRGVRILPLWLAVVGVSAVYSAFAGRFSSAGLVHALTFSQIWSQQLGVIPQGWTLNLEVIYYLTLPLVLLLVWRRENAQRAIVLLGILSIGAVAVRPVLWKFGVRGPSVEVPLHISDSWPFFAAGAALAIMRFRMRGRLEIFAVATAGLVFYAVMPNTWLAALPPQSGVFIQWALVLGIVTSAPMPHRSVAWLGRISYSVYLWHWLILTVLVDHTQLAAGLADPVFVGLAIVLAVAAGHISWRLIEVPSRRALLRRYASGSGRAGATGAAGARSVPWAATQPVRRRAQPIAGLPAARPQRRPRRAIAGTPSAPERN
jgi:peptidoglycan/LPS O-acetylase OafA/YrhL